MTVTILQGDVRDVLATLQSDSVDCCVTSPPYWGLRDYGTAEWVGGDPLCSHRSPTMREGRNENRATLPGSVATNRDQLLLAHRTGCGLCGARKIDLQIGLEPTLADHISVMVDVFREVRRVLKPSGTLWVNYGDCYATSPNGRSAADTKAAGKDDRTFRDKPFSTIQGRMKSKDLCMVPNRLAIALQDDGWWVRSEIIWHKPNPMPESAKDRPTTSHEKIWLLAKSERYFFDADAVREQDSGQDHPRAILHQPEPSGGVMGPHTGIRKASGRNGEGRNIRNVWTIATQPFPEAHFATFPPDLAERCIKAGCPVGGRVLDPFGGAGTTGLVADRLGRDATLIELNPAYIEIARNRISDDAPLFAKVAAA